MALNFRRIRTGIEIIPKTSSTVDAAGELDFDTSSNKLNLHNGTTSSPVVTEIHTATLTNKTIAVGSNNITSTANRAAQFNVSTGNLEASTVTDTELGYVSGVTSAIQTQINSKQASGNYITALTGDVSATGPGSVAATVNTVAGSSAANIHAAELLANAATNLNTASTIVKRDGSGNFVAGTITATAISASGSNTLGTMILNANTIQSSAASDLLLQSLSNKNIQLQPNGTGTTIVTSSLEVDKYIQVTRLDDSTTTGSAATLNAATTSFVKVTNVSLVSLSAIPAGQNGQELILKNATGNSFIINNEDVGVTAANRILTGTGNIITVSNNSAVSLIYDLGAARWQVYGGSGGGGTPTLFGSRGSPRTIVAGTGITSGAGHMSTTASDQIIFIIGNSAPTTITAIPAIEAGTIVGQKMTIIGRSNANTVTINNSAGAVELNGNVILGANDSLLLLWDGTAWVQYANN